MTLLSPLTSPLSRGWFRLVHGRNLVYNTCWEDPRLDRVALELKPSDNVLVITSAGCNALDYLLEGPNKVNAVDMNPRQNALLELKAAGIRALDFERFFELFGRGRLPRCEQVYQQELRGHLSPRSQAYWDKHIAFFSGRGWRPTFYFRGTAGTFARMINFYIDRVAKVRDQIDEILSAPTLVEQQNVYNNGLRAAFWTRFIRWAVGRDATLSLVGVPLAQRKQVEMHYAGGITGFIEDSLDAVFRQLPLHDNYFWRVYLTGRYTHDCCPEYLKAENFARLKAGLIDRLDIHTNSVAGFLEKTQEKISRFVLLDHMDWMSSTGNTMLAEEWKNILARAADGARVLWRSGGLSADFVDAVRVNWCGQRKRLGDLLKYNQELANELHPRDRVHTYGSFYIADLPNA